MAAAPTPFDTHDQDELILRLEAVDVPASVKKFEVKKHLPDFGEDKIHACEVRIHMQSGARELVPDELDTIVEELQHLAQSGPTGKSNTNTVKVQHEIHRVFAKMRCESGGDSVTIDADVASPSWKVGKDKLTLTWKLEGVIACGKLADLVRLVGRDDVLLTSEQCQGELF